jgi:hypothetical protein
VAVYVLLGNSYATARLPEISLIDLIHLESEGGHLESMNTEEVLE